MEEADKSYCQIPNEQQCFWYGIIGELLPEFQLFFPEVRARII